MSNKEKSIRDYLDEKGLQKDLSGYYILESAISYAINNSYGSYQGIFEQMMKDNKLNCTPRAAYSASVYALKRAGKKTGVKSFILLAADNIIRNTSYEGKEGN